MKPNGVARSLERVELDALEVVRAPVVEPARVAHQHGAAVRDLALAQLVPGAPRSFGGLQPRRRGGRRGGRGGGRCGGLRRAPAWRSRIPTGRRRRRRWRRRRGISRMAPGRIRWKGILAAAGHALAPRVGAAFQAAAHAADALDAARHVDGAHLVAHRLQSAARWPRVPCPSRFPWDRCGCRSWEGRWPPAGRASSRARRRAPWRRSR